ncbi:MAG: T9SS type A sorting domain-containing protein [Bacteroidetes bacterium]|nr:MAG: T9SS type A sorting domain-containing protein [Bacteroidota bacterium]
MCRFVFIANAFLPFLMLSGVGGSEAKAQTFYDSTQVPILDTTKFCVSINVSGLPNKIDSSFGLASVCFNITHTFVADVVVTLRSPDSTVITLAGGVGGAGHNFTNTCLAMNGVNGSIANSNAPFTGIFIPQQSLNNLNNGQNPNGAWKFCISDTYFADTGSLHNFNITFANNPPPDPLPPAVLCAYCSCVNSADTCDLLPDMTASALCIQQYHLEGPGNLQIANATPNIGRGPIEIHAIDSCFCDTVPVPCSTTICPGGNPVKHIIIQRIYQRVGNDTLLHYDRVAGHMSYHPTHGHLHTDHWADYSLRMATSNPDATTWPIVGQGTKQSFCLINLEDCTNALGYCKDSLDSTLTMATIPNAGFGLYTGCGLDQGIYPGYLDVYDASLNGPILLSTICNGQYYIVSITDPENKFLESNENNNWVSVPVTLTQQGAPSGTASYNYSLNGLQTAFTNTSPSGNTYLWNFGDGNWDTAYSPVHTYTAAGTYTVSLVSLNQCFTTTSQVVVITGMDEYHQVNLTLHVYPNPITQNPEVMYYLPDNTNVILELTDLSGRKLETLIHEKQKQGLHKISLAGKFEKFSSGVYLMNLDCKFGRNTIKIIK